jgi:hypothetical protein
MPGTHQIPSNSDKELPLTIGGNPDAFRRWVGRGRKGAWNSLMGLLYFTEIADEGDSNPRLHGDELFQKAVPDARGRYIQIIGAEIELCRQAVGRSRCAYSSGMSTVKVMASFTYDTGGC